MDPSSLPSLTPVIAARENNKKELTEHLSVPDVAVQKFVYEFPEDLKKITAWRVETSDVKTLNNQVQLITTIADLLYNCHPADSILNKKIHEISNDVTTERDAIITKIFETIHTSKTLVMDNLARGFVYGGDSLLHMAAWAGDTETCKKLLAQGVAVNERNDLDWTPLMGAAIHGHLVTAVVLIEAKAQINLEDKYHNTALNIALRHDRFELADFLHSKGAYVSQAHLIKVFEDAAAGTSHLAPDYIVKKIEYSHSDLNFTVSDARLTPLLVAIQCAKNASDWNAVIDKLLELKVDINAVGKDGQTALHYACSVENLALVQKLLAHKAEPNSATKSGITPIYHAIRTKDKALFEALEKKGAKYDSVLATTGRTCLHVAAELGDSTFIQAFYDQKLGSKEFTNHQDNQGKTALLVALENEKFESAEVLVQAGADDIIKDTNGMSALQKACEKNATAVIHKLLESNRPALASVVDNHKHTLLHMAAKHGCYYSSYNLLDQLLELPFATKEFINRRDDEGKTALLVALEQDITSNPYTLIQAGADGTIPDNTGVSAFQKALAWKWPDLVLQLLNQNTDCNFTVGADKNSALMEAIILSQKNTQWTDVVVKLIELQKSIDQTNARQQTALHLACKLAPHFAEKLLNAGVDPNKLDADGYSALAYLVQFPDYSVDGLREKEATWPKGVVQKFASRGANLNAILPNGNTLLQEAIQHESSNAQVELLNAGADPNALGKNGQSAISVILQGRSLFFSHELLTKGANLCVWDKEGNSLLHRLIEYGTEESSLLGAIFAKELPAELINKQNNKGETALFLACKKQKIPWVSHLLGERRVDPTIADKQNLPPIVVWLENNRRLLEEGKKITATFLRKGASPDVTLSYGSSLLHYAASRGWLEIIVSALARSQNKKELLDKKDYDQKTALEIALTAHEEGIAKYLIRAGADCSTLLPRALRFKISANTMLEMLATQTSAQLFRDNEFLNEVIRLTAENPEWEAVIDRLLELGVDVNVPNAAGETPLDVACKTNNQALAYELLERGAKPERKEKETSALALLVQNIGTAPIKPGLIQKFRDKGADLNIRDAKRNTPLLLAILDSPAARACAEALLDAGADPNCTNLNEETPLKLAMEKENGILIEKLLAKGARLSARDKDGQSLFQIAAERKYDCFIDITISHLIAHGALFLPIDEKGNTILHAVAETGYTNFIEAIIGQRKFFPKEFLNQKNKDGKTALDIALDKKNLATIEMLIDAGCVNAEPSQLQKIFPEASPACILEMLSLPGQNINFTFTPQNETKKTTPLLWAISLQAKNSDWKKVVDRLLELHVDIHAKNEDNYDALGLACATENPDPALVRKLLEAGAHPNEKTGGVQRTALAHWTCNIVPHDESLLNLFLAKGADLNAPDIDKLPPLLLALNSAIHEKMALWLIKSGADPKVAQDKGYTPLHLAVYNNLESVVKELIKKQVSLDALDHLAITPLHTALKNRKTVHLAPLLLDAGANPTIAQHNKMTPLHLAAQIQAESVVKELIKKQVPLDALDAEKNTALHYALQDRSDFSLAYLLLDAGANPKITNATGLTALHLAANGSDEVLVKKLIEKKVDINATASGQKTPLWYALQHKDSFPLALLLLDNRADPNIWSVKGPLHYAVEQKADNVVAKLLEKGALFPAPDSEGKSALDRAASVHYDTFITLLIASLIAQKIDLDNIDKKGSSLLHFASATGYEPFIKAVLEKTKPTKEAINAPDENGKTALHLALEHASSQAAELLIAAGAEPSKKNKDGKTALQIAFEKNLPAAILAMLFLPNPGLNFTLTEDQTPLTYAIKGNSQDWDIVAQRLLELGLSTIDHKDQRNENALSRAASNKNYPLAMKLLEKGANPNIPAGNYNRTPLITLAVATAPIDPKLLALLKEKKADLDAVGNDGKAALHMALTHPFNEATALWLIENGANPNIPDSEGGTPLGYAIMVHAEEVINKLIEKGAHLDVVTNNGNTLLDTAVAASYNHFLDIYMAALEAQKIPFNNIDGKNTTLLHMAAKSGRLQWVEEVLNKPFATQEFILQKDQMNESALAYAFRGENPNVILKLMEQNFSFDFTIGDDKRPPLVAATDELYRKMGTESEKSWHDLVLKLMQKCNKSACDKNGKNVLHLACEYKQYNDITFMLESGVNPDNKTVTGQTPLMILAATIPPPNREITEQILAKADINAQDNAGNTAFMIACEKGNIGIALVLRIKKASTLLLPKNKKVPLLFFIKQNWKDTFQNAIAGDARLDCIDAEGNTLLHNVVLWNRPEFFELLLKQKSLNIDILARNNQGNTYLNCLQNDKNAIPFLEAIFTPRDLKGIDLAQFLQSLEQDPAPLLGLDRSPLEIAFLLGNVELARTLVKKGIIAKESLAGEFEALSKKYTLSATFGFRLSSVNHFRIETIYQSDSRHLDMLPAIPEAPKDSTPETLIQLFDSSEIPLASCGLKTKKEGSEKLAAFIKKLDRKNLQHEQIAAACCHIAEKLSKPGSDKTAIFEKLFQLVEKKGPALYVGFLELYSRINTQKLPTGLTIDSLRTNFAGDAKALEAFIQKFKDKNIAGLDKESAKYEEIEIALCRIAECLAIPGCYIKPICEGLSKLFSLQGAALHCELQQFARTARLMTIPMLFAAIDPSHFTTFGITKKEEAHAKEESLREFLRTITEKQLSGFHPKNYAETYAQMETALGHVATFLSSHDENKIEIFTEIFKLFDMCGPALYSEILELFYKTVRNIPLTPQNALLLSLENFRRSLVKSIISTSIQESVQTRHDYISIVKAYPELALPEVAELGSLEDIFTDCVTEGRHLDVMNTFWNRYTASAIIEWVTLQFLGDEKNRGRFIDFMKTQIPASFHPELAQKDREYAFLTEHVYTEDLTTIRQEAIIDGLLKMNIIRGV